MNDFFYDSAINVFSFVCLGAVLGAVYDVFRVLRLSRKGGGNLSGGIYDKPKPKKGIMTVRTPKFLKLTDGTLTFIEDIFFWIIVFLAEEIYIYYINAGEPRADFFLLSVLGFVLYRVSLGRLVIFLSGQIIFFVRCLLSRLVYVIIYPVRMLWKFISKIVSKAWGASRKAALGAERRAYTRREKKRLLDLSAKGFKEN